MDPITIKDAERLSSPNPFALLVTCDDAGRQNIMAISWWTYASNNPPTVAVCLSDRGFSGGLIKSTGEFSLCLPGEDLTHSAFMCGTCSGRDTDKAEKFGIELAPSVSIRPMLVKCSKVAMECKLVSTAAAGDHTVYIAEVVAAHAQPGIKHLMCANGYAKLEAF